MGEASPAREKPTSSTHWRLAISLWGARPGDVGRGGNGGTPFGLSTATLGKINKYLISHLQEKPTLEKERGYSVSLTLTDLDFTLYKEVREQVKVNKYQTHWDRKGN